MEKYFGKYRGKVTNNNDPMQLGRVQVEVPSVLGDGRLSWAMPCVPYAGMQVGFFAIPPINANIWVEFEGGDIDYPIWSGCFWGTGEVPAKPAVEQIKVFKTQSVSITLNDMPGAGGAILEVNPPGVSAPLKMTFNSAGIEIDCNPANVKLTPKGIELSIPPTTIRMDPSNLEAESPPASIKLSASGVEATNGPAALKLNGPKVDINNGAVEVV
ncbi:phage baseplate assembly protein V [Desulfonema magnum]|uniref:Gp5/Type VI secretion system Vgr protein OB-fold domain-containing protein n=1 Tax=Desulfonema magnum TaxID=45655 RepID=A0A975BQ25_9BACT|nr:phage baseplate assembly protein V [Desulfonema magnum]QTA89094.1 Uncharacterized protein dnm_051420 [Desulfonema magnum]